MATSEAVKRRLEQESKRTGEKLAERPAPAPVQGAPYNTVEQPVRKTESGKYGTAAELAKGLDVLLRPGLSRHEREKKYGAD
jgi:hypothetical protein